MNRLTVIFILIIKVWPRGALGYRGASAAISKSRNIGRVLSLQLGTSCYQYQVEH